MRQRCDVLRLRIGARARGAAAAPGGGRGGGGGRGQGADRAGASAAHERGVRRFSSGKKKTALEIRDFLSGEFEPVPLADVMAVLRAREAAGAIKLVPKPLEPAPVKKKVIIRRMSGNTRAGWRTYLARVAPRDREELVLLLAGVAVLILLVGFMRLASEVLEGETLTFDKEILTALRDPADLSRPIGPRWLLSGALDITALGSATVLGLVVFAVTGFLVLQGMWRMGTFVFVACSGAWFINHGLKQLFQRPRPDVVPHLREVMTMSFPSGHAHGVGRRLPDARRLADARRHAETDEMVLHGHRDAGDVSGRCKPRVPRRALPNRRAGRLARGAVVGAALLAGRAVARAACGVEA